MGNAIRIRNLALLLLYEISATLRTYWKNILLFLMNYTFIQAVIFV